MIDGCLVPEMCFILLMPLFDVIQCECMVLCLSVDMWCVSSRGCRSIGAILVFRCRRIVDVVVAVSTAFCCNELVTKNSLQSTKSVVGGKAGVFVCFSAPVFAEVSHRSLQNFTRNMPRQSNSKLSLFLVAKIRKHSMNTMARCHGSRSFLTKAI